MWSSQRSMDNADKCVQIYELSTNTTSRMIYAFAKDRTCPLPATALPHSDSSAQTDEYDYVRTAHNTGALQLHLVSIESPY